METFKKFFPYNFECKKNANTNTPKMHLIINRMWNLQKQLHFLSMSLLHIYEVILHGEINSVA